MRESTSYLRGARLTGTGTGDKPEHGFLVVKQKSGFVKVRYRGLRRIHTGRLSTRALANLFVNRKKLPLRAAWYARLADRVSPSQWGLARGIVALGKPAQVQISFLSPARFVDGC